MTEFYEKQKFNSIWGYLIFFIVAAANYYYVVKTGIDSYQVIIITIITALLILFLFEFAYLESKVTKEGISYKFWPFQRKEATLFWKEIASVEILKYRPIKDYGGWGVRMGFKKGRAFNTRGDIGLLIHKKDGKDLLIGTQKAPEMLQSLQSTKKVKVSSTLG